MFACTLAVCALARPLDAKAQLTAAPPGAAAPPAAQPQPAAGKTPARAPQARPAAGAVPPAVTPSLGNPPPAASASTESAPPAPASGPLLTLREAVRSTLRKHPAIAQARATLAARSADLLAAGAPFDPVVSSSLAHNREAQALLPPDRAAPAERALLEDATSFRLGASAGFQWGMTVIPSVTLERVKAQRNPNPLGFPDAASQRARADLKVLQPLLRGRGTDGAASGLRAAARAREAAEESAGHAAQAQVFDTIATYYRWVAASSDLQRFVESVARAQKLFDETRVLVEAEHRPRADLRQVEASLENQRRGMLEAENNVALARYDLGLAMGLDGSEVPEWQAVDGFPAARVPELSADATVERALHARRDLHAADQSVASSSALLAGAERNALPALDLGVSVGYAGALDKDGIGPFFGATVRNVPGVNAGASLTLELPVSNDAARATRDLRRAEQAGAQIARADLDRQIRSGVRSALSEVRLSAAALGAAQHAVELLTQAVVDERDKLHEGLSTIIDVVLTEERLTQAELTRTAQQLRFTTALARLQFESGALPETESTLAASPEALLTPEALHAGQ